LTLNRDLDKRRKSIDSDLVMESYAASCNQLKQNLSRERELNQLAANEVREANKLLEQRFGIIKQCLNKLSDSVGNIYPQLRPGASAYLSFATNPISLFEEGISILAQHGRSEWTEVL
jgi:chromosome segregation ATPase